MGLPAKLKNFAVFADGASYLGQVSEIQLPKLAVKTGQFRGGGMLAEVDVDLGLEKLEMETKFGGLAVGMLRQFGRAGIAASLLRFTGAYQEDTAGGVKPAELVVLGKHVEIDPGTGKAGDDTEWTVKSTLSYLKWTVSGRVEVEIDVAGMIYTVGGIDRMAEIRAAILQ